MLGARAPVRSRPQNCAVFGARRSGRCWPPRASRLLRGPPGSCAPRAVSFCVETVNEAKNYAGQLCRNAVSTHSHDTSHVQDTF